MLNLLENAGWLVSFFRGGERGFLNVRLSEWDIKFHSLLGLKLQR